MAKPKAEWKTISIPGQSESYLAIVNGKEIGTICKTGKKAAWTISAGIGCDAKLIGTCYNKEGAKYLLLTYRT